MAIDQQNIDEAYTEGCPSLPRVAWWNTSHLKIIKFIDEQFNGAWDTYIQRWVGYRNKMQRILEDDGTAVVRSRGLHLKGSVLAAHISDIEQRIRVTRCLKTKFGRRLAVASGQSTTATAPHSTGVDGLGACRKLRLQAPKRGVQKNAHQTILSAVEEGRLNVEIVASHNAKTPVFQVINRGDRWPRTGTVGIYWESRTSLTERRVRPANSQQMVFKARYHGKSAAGEFAPWPFPASAKRGFDCNLKINCRTS